MKLHNSGVCDWSAYCNHHSTDTALLYIYDHLHLINAIGSQKVTCLCLLDLSAAFDIINHNILITRLSSQFGINSSVLCWFKSTYHLIYHLAPFVLNVITTSFPCILPLVMSHKALFSALYSSSCTLHLYTPISSLPLTTTIYADDSCSRSTHSTLTQALRTFKTLFSRSLPK